MVNGPWFDPETLASCERRPGVRVVRIPTPGISGARLEGRRQVRTPYFLMLDDDDELHPNAIRALIDVLKASTASVGVALGDAFNTGRGTRYGFVPSIERIESNSLDALMHQNWLILQATLFRSSRVGPDFFDIQTVSNECTLIAFKLALAGVGVKVLDQAVATIHYSPEVPSESKTEHFITREPEALAQVLAWNVPKETARALKRKIGAAQHFNAEWFLRRGKLSRAWVAHWASLSSPGGWRYLAFTRRLIGRSLLKPLQSRATNG